MTGEIIEVCQECGHLIEPEEVTAPWGDRYRITLCQRDECIADRLLRAWRADWERERQRRTSLFADRWRYVPIVNHPRGITGITGITGV